METKEDFNRQQVIDLKIQRADLFKQIETLNNTIKHLHHTIHHLNYHNTKIKEHINFINNPEFVKKLNKEYSN